MEGWGGGEGEKEIIINNKNNNSNEDRTMMNNKNNSKTPEVKQRLLHGAEGDEKRNEKRTSQRRRQEKKKRKKKKDSKQNTHVSSLAGLHLLARKGDKDLLVHASLPRLRHYCTVKKRKIGNALPLRPVCLNMASQKPRYSVNNSAY